AAAGSGDGPSDLGGGDRRGPAVGRQPGGPGSGPGAGLTGAVRFRQSQPHCPNRRSMGRSNQIRGALMLKSLSAAVLGLALISGPAAAQDPQGAGVVASQLDAVANQFDLVAGSRASGRLQQGGSHTARVQSPGGAIFIVGVCDENCSDLDIVVRDSSGRQV